MESNPYASPSSNLYGSAAGAGSNVSQTVIFHLAATRPWVIFMSVIAFILAGFSLLGAVGMVFAGVIGAGASRSSGLGGAEMILMIVMAAFYALMGLLYIYPGIKLWKYASRIATLSASRNQTDLESALDEQRGFWKFVGIITIISIIAGLGIVVTSVVIAATAASAAANL